MANTTWIYGFSTVVALLTWSVSDMSNMYQIDFGVSLEIVSQWRAFEGREYFRYCFGSVPCCPIHAQLKCSLTASVISLWSRACFVTVGSVAVLWQCLTYKPQRFTVLSCLWMSPREREWSFCFLFERLDSFEEFVNLSYTIHSLWLLETVCGSYNQVDSLRRDLVHWVETWRVLQSPRFPLAPYCSPSGHS